MHAYPGRIAAVTLSVAFSLQALGSPSIDQITREGDERITLQGAGFGGGPTVLLYDDLSQGDVSPEGVDLRPRVGEWAQVGGSASEYVEGPFGAGSRGLIVRETDSANSVNLVFGEPDDAGVHELRHFQEVYYSFAVRDLGDFPDGGPTSFSNRLSTMDSWLMFGYEEGSSRYSEDGLGEPGRHGVAVPVWIGWTFSVAGENDRISFHQHELTNRWVFGDWVTYMFHAKLDPDDPYGDAEAFFAFLNSNAYHENRRTGPMMEAQSAEGVPYPYWDRIKFNPWVRDGDSEIRRAMGNFYVAIGENANARILLTDAERLDQSTKIQHLVPTQWQDDFIEAELPAFDFPEPAYVHVINADNLASDGVQMRSPPAAPGGLQLQ